jgi:tRNA A-37 threonylcarbamoyl transferase component Bud32
VEAAKASRARDIGRESGLFNVPEVVNFNAEAGVLEFERLRSLSTLLELAVRKDGRLPGLLEKTGKALAVIHEKLTLPEEMKYAMPHAWMGDADENVFIHGDFACINVCYHEESGELVILDFSAAPMIGMTPTFGSRYFDILLFISSLFQGAPYARVFKWDADSMVETFLIGYGNKISEQKLKHYMPEMCCLQRSNIRDLSRQRSSIRAPLYLSWQMFMLARFRSFLHKMP